MDVLDEQRRFWTTRNRHSFYVGLLLLAFALIIQIYAGHYSYRKASAAPSAHDVLLDNLPTLNLNYVIVQGSFVAIAIAAYLLLRYPHHLLFGIKAIALFIVIRAMFMSLTTIGIYPEQTVFDGGTGVGIYNFFNFPGNFFFSGHTGSPLLIALIFWHERRVRRFFIGVSLLFAVSVIMAHVHYSIDVFAAPFMTYGIFRMSQWFFRDDYLVLLRDYKEDYSSWKITHHAA